MRIRKLNRKVSNESMSWKWSKQRLATTLMSKTFKCLSTSTGKRLPWNWTLPPVEISSLLASGQSWASWNFNRLSGITIRQVRIHCRSLQECFMGVASSVFMQRRPLLAFLPAGECIPVCPSPSTPILNAVIFSVEKYAEHPHMAIIFDLHAFLHRTHKYRSTKLSGSPQRSRRK